MLSIIDKTQNSAQQHSYGVLLCLSLVIVFVANKTA
jgi:hypothetical protein